MTTDMKLKMLKSMTDEEDKDVRRYVPVVDEDNIFQMEGVNEE